MAELSPKPDVPAVIRKLPTRRAEAPRAQVAELGPDAVNFEMPTAPVQPVRNSRITRPAVVAPLAPARYKVQFTASGSLRDKLERLTGLMRSSIPDGDLAALIEDAVTEKLERLESRRFAETKAPRKKPGTLRYKAVVASYPGCSQESRSKTRSRPMHVCRRNVSECRCCMAAGQVGNRSEACAEPWNARRALADRAGRVL